MVRRALFGIALMFFAPPLHADLVWDWSYSSNQFTGNGTLTTESTLTTGISGFTGYQIDNISGVFDLNLITGLLPPAGYLSNDNLLGPSQPQLDSIGGLSFTTNGSVSFVNISYPGSPLYLAQTTVIDDNGGGIFTAIVETPEPATAVLIGWTLLLFALIVRRKGNRLNYREAPRNRSLDTTYPRWNAPNVGI